MGSGLRTSPLLRPNRMWQSAPVFWAAVRKDIRLLRRDRGALAGLFVLPILFIAVFGSVLSVDPGRRVWTVAVAVSPESEPGRRAVAALRRAEQFEVEITPTADDVRGRVSSGEVKLGLIFAADFDPAADRPAELVVDEAALRELRPPLEGALSGIIGAALVGAPNQLKVIEARAPPGNRRPLDHVDGFQLAVPGNAVLFCFFLSVTVGLSFVIERRTGTWRRMLATPVRRSTLLIAKLVPYFLVGLAQMSLFFAVGHFGFGMGVGGSIIGLAALTAAVCVCAVSLGLLLASLATTERQVGGVGSLVVLTMGLVGGCMYPRLGMPELMQDLGLAFPHAWALDGYYTLLIRGGSGIADVLAELGALLGFAAVFAAIGLRRFRFEDGPG